MCVVKDCSKSIMAAAKDEPEHDVLEQDEPSSTGTECAFCIHIVSAIGSCRAFLKWQDQRYVAIILDRPQNPESGAKSNVCFHNAGKRMMVSSYS